MSVIFKSNGKNSRDTPVGEGFRHLSDPTYSSPENSAWQALGRAILGEDVPARVALPSDSRVVDIMWEVTNSIVDRGGLGAGGGNQTGGNGSSSTDTASATEASASATEASASATEASASATEASASATEASASATEASTSATEASASATEASASATEASNSATEASASATEASNSATEASASATEASASATEASASATEASASATEASNSAAQAVAAAEAAAQNNSGSGLPDGVEIISPINRTESILKSGFSNFNISSGEYQRVSYERDFVGRVSLSGMFKGGSQGGIVTKLPISIRPEKTIRFLCACGSDSATCVVEIPPDGNLKVISGFSPIYTSLSNISYTVSPV